jgi:methyl-accepting chemotaxis protein
MGQAWTFGRKLGAGFAAVMSFSLIIGGIAIYALRTVVAGKDRVIEVNAQNLIGAARLAALAEERSNLIRGYLLSPSEAFLKALRISRQETDTTLNQLRKRVATEEERRLLEEIQQASAARSQAVDRLIQKHQAGDSSGAIIKQFETEVQPRYQGLKRDTEDYIKYQERALESGKRPATESASRAITLMIGAALAGVGIAAGVAWILGRTLSRQIGSAVQPIQSSSSELQAAANQQTTSSKEQAASMSEISTTVKELLSTAQQIAESAQRVAHIAESTAAAAQTSGETVVKTQEAVGEIKRQVDLIVAHMLELGKKSQQIGGIIEIINELAEQTNILAINATIEAAGAGESGRRFATVADEIRKLADRVSGSTKEIRILIKEIRAAVNTTVRATESGAKTVEAGTRQFGEVATAFTQIADLVGTTSEATREIELSTRQQSTAVEQVTVAATNVAQAAKESEASAAQTLQTVSELAALSRDLGRLIQSPNTTWKVSRKPLNVRKKFAEEPFRVFFVTS